MKRIFVSLYSVFIFSLIIGSYLPINAESIPGTDDTNALTATADSTAMEVAPSYVLITKIDATPGPQKGQSHRASADFSLTGQIPTGVQKLYFFVDHPKSDYITFDIWQDKSFGMDPVIIKGLQGSGSKISIPSSLDKLYVSNVTSSSGSLTGTPNMTVYIIGLY